MTGKWQKKSLPSLERGKGAPERVMKGLLIMAGVEVGIPSIVAHPVMVAIKVSVASLFMNSSYYRSRDFMLPS